MFLSTFVRVANPARVVCRPSVCDPFGHVHRRSVRERRTGDVDADLRCAYELLSFPLCVVSRDQTITSVHLKCLSSRFVAIGQRIVARLRERTYAAAIRQEVEFVERGEGDVLSRLSVDSSIVGERCDMRLLVPLPPSYGYP